MEIARSRQAAALPYTISMKKQPWAWILLSLIFLPLPALASERQSAAYLGFDRNDYPGDANLSALRNSFAFTGYWLSTPPGERSNSWRGKRTAVQRAGFGFLLLFNGRDYAQLKSRPNPGPSDGTTAVRSALAEGFPRGSVIFLDQEQGGRMLPEQKRYVFAWAEAVRRAGFRPGIYCSGIEIAESDGGRISTAGDLHDSPQGRQLVFWVANDACPPSPGCSFPRNPPTPEASGTPFAEVWQFAQSPVRPQFAAACRQSYNPDGNCYPPELPGRKLHLDVNSSRSPDPSHTRR
ncbi:MAG: glycoside hydrolase domain-containing protein [Candidatus Korobacteraceae bacterium]